MKKIEYIKPEMMVVEMESEDAILGASNASIGIDENSTIESDDDLGGNDFGR